MQCGAACLPMIAMVMVGAVVSGGVLLPRTVLKPLVPAGCLLAAVGMVILTGIASDSSYVANVLPALLVTGIGFGFIFGPIQNAATSGVKTRDAGVASAMVNTAQQIGGSIGLAAFSSLSAIAINNQLAGTNAAAEAAIAGYHLVFWVTAAVFACASALAAILFPRRTITTTSRPTG